MDTQCVLIGEIQLAGESIVLRAEIPSHASSARIALLKYKLAYLLDTRFKPAPPPKSNEMTLDQVLKLWNCHRVTVLRRMQAGVLRPINRHGRLLFDRGEVEHLI